MDTRSTTVIAEAVIEEARKGAEARYARWDDALFDEIAAPAYKSTIEHFDLGEKANRQLVAAYATLLVEGVGQGYIGRRLPERYGVRAWTSLLPHFLLDLCPWHLHRLPEAQRLPALVELWNLGEGLLAEPMWLNRYVVARCGGRWELGGWKEWLIETLEPVLTPPPAPTWTGPLALTQLDAGDWDDEFVPGPMHLAAPSVLCIQNQLDPDAYLSVLLQRDAETNIIGETPDLGAWDDREADVKVMVESGLLAVGEELIELPLIGEVQDLLVTSSGFIIATAPDSQLLWVVESR